MPTISSTSIDYFSQRVHDVDWTTVSKEVPGEALVPGDEPEPEIDERTAALLRAVQTRYPEATAETLGEFSEKILQQEDGPEKLAERMRRLAPTEDVTPGEWLWDVEEARIAAKPRTRLDEPAPAGTFVTFFGEEVAPPKAKIRPGTHKRRDRSYPQLWNDGELQQLPPPEQEGPDLGLAM